MRSLSQSRDDDSEIGNRFLGTAATIVPQSDMSGVATIIPMIVGAVLANAVIEFDTIKIVSSLPGGGYQ